MTGIPAFDEFRRLREENAALPLAAAVSCDFETPVSLFSRWKNEKYAFLLESVEGGEQWGRYSFIGLDPIRIFRWSGRSRGDPLKALRAFLGKPSPADPSLPRFSGGIVGYVSYEAVRLFEKIRSKKKGQGIPVFYFVKPRLLLAHDNLKHSLRIHYFIEGKKDLKNGYRKGRLAIEKVIREIRKSPAGVRQSKGKRLRWKGSLEKDEYEKRVARIREYILAGDVTQTVLSLRFQARGAVDPFQVYRRLRQINPSPYLFYLKFGDLKIVGASPETMVRLEGGEMVLRPIAGTRPRGKSDEEDLANERELLADPKERAEHIMLVDLGRNDLGRVAVPGTVRVDELMTVERYSHVMHIVSNIRGRPAKGKDAFDLLKAAFPAGTLTGSPKIRAMEIIEELEPVVRGTYGGCVGYFSDQGNMDMAITIRSAFFSGGNVLVQAGAGIVADSVPEREYEECLNKAKGMMEAIEG